MRPCQNCGAPIENSEEFCGECSKLDLPSEAEKVEDKQQAARRQRRIANGRQAARRRGETAFSQEMGMDGAETEMEKVESQFFIAVLGFPIVLMVLTAGLAWSAYGTTGLLYAMAIESFVVLLLIGIAHEMGSHFEGLGIVTAVVTLIFIVTFWLLIAHNRIQSQTTPDTSQTPIFRQFGDAV